MAGGVARGGGVEVLALGDAGGGVEVLALDAFGDVAEGGGGRLWAAPAEETPAAGVYALADRVDALGGLPTASDGGDGGDGGGDGREAPAAAAAARLRSPWRFSDAAAARAVRAPAATRRAIAAAVAAAGGGAPGVAAVLARASRAAADTDWPVVALVPLPSGGGGGGVDGPPSLVVGVLRASGVVGALRPATPVEAAALWGASPRPAGAGAGAGADWPVGELAWRVAGAAAVQVAAAEVVVDAAAAAAAGGTASPTAGAAAAALLALGRGRTATDPTVPLTALAASAAVRDAGPGSAAAAAAGLTDALAGVRLYLSPTEGGVLLWALRRDWGALRLAAAAAAAEQRPAAALYGTAMAALGDVVADASVPAGGAMDEGADGGGGGDSDEEEEDVGDPVALVALAFGALQQAVAVADGWDRAVAESDDGRAGAPPPFYPAVEEGGPAVWATAAHPALTLEEVGDSALLAALSAVPTRVDDNDDNDDDDDDDDDGMGGGAATAAIRTCVDGPLLTGPAGFWVRARAAALLAAAIPLPPPPIAGDDAPPPPPPPPAAADAAKAAFFLARAALGREAPSRAAHEAVRATALASALTAGSLAGAVQALTAPPHTGAGGADGEGAAAAALVAGVDRLVAAAAGGRGGVGALAAVPRLPAPVEVLISRALARRARAGGG